MVPRTPIHKSPCMFSAFEFGIGWCASRLIAKGSPFVVKMEASPSRAYHHTPKLPNDGIQTWLGGWLQCFIPPLLHSSPAASGNVLARLKWWTAVYIIGGNRVVRSESCLPYRLTDSAKNHSIYQDFILRYVRRR